MAILPILATAISALFAWSLLRRFRASRHLQMLAWAVGLAMFALASFTLFLADIYGWGPWIYRLFWLFGALLNVPWLATGSIALAWPKAARLAIGGMVIVSFYALIATVTASPNTTALITDAIPRGREVWVDAPNMMTLLRILSIGGWLVVVGVALWTSRQARGMTPPAARVRANMLIATGVTIVAVGGFALGRVGGESAVAIFSITLAFGVLVMYAGFLTSSKVARYTVAEPGDQAT